MHFAKLRLVGFKSFVEAAEFRIEPGLTGVVGPNGCGKSNILEALRWVMGAASAKAMRGEGMDDVIFSGSGARPPRNHAEVVLTIDNEDRDAPGEFAAQPVIEVVRRIDRGEGSTFRVNGREVRARDVQLLFADASTGANSPALVRQGQISELIAAKPANRRRILEEAAGVSGLHGRRHEAELKVRAAQANLDRLEDLARELDASLVRLRREARSASRYREIAGEIRTLSAALLHGRWIEARGQFAAAEGERNRCALAVQEASAATLLASGRLERADAAIAPLRQAQTAAAAVVHALAIEKDRLERSLEDAAAEAARLATEIERIAADDDRERRLGEDAAATVARLEGEAVAAQARAAAAPAKLPQLEVELARLEAERAAADETVEALAAAIAADRARAESLHGRLEDARSRLSRTSRALAQARSEQDALAAGGPSALAEARGELAAASQRLEEARAALAEAESDRAVAGEDEGGSRSALRTSEDELGERIAEARGLARLAASPARGDYPAALDSVDPDRGLEAALAAALGDDLDAALDARAAAFWAGASADPPAWPQGAQPLAPLIAAPAQLAARLAFVALVEAKDGERLQRQLFPGARLVSRAGDLWRWDGLTVRAGSPRPAQARLEQRARLARIEAQIDKATPAVAAARERHAAAAATLAAGVEAVRLTRAEVQGAEAAALAAREVAERLEREGARREARFQSLADTIARFAAEEVEAAAALAAIEQEASQAPPTDERPAALEQARVGAHTARAAASAAHAALDGAQRDRDQAASRLTAIEAEMVEWRGRGEHAGERRAALAASGEKARSRLELARAAPAAAAEKRQALMDKAAGADQRLAAAGDALAVAESERAAADRDSRAADALAADAREAHAAFAARLEAAQERLALCVGQIRDSLRLAPEALGREIAAGGAPAIDDLRAAEARLAELERAREAIGPVNLLAESEAAQLAERTGALRAERADLSGALARLREGIDELNAEGRERLMAAFEVIDGHFRTLFTALFEGGKAELRLVEADDPLEAGLEIYACPPGKRLAVMSLMSGGEQALTAVALIFAVFLSNPAPICVLDEVDAPLDDANVERFCNLLDEMRRRAPTRFVAITHNPLTMSKMDRLFGVTMPEQGVSQLVSVDLRQAEALAAQ